LGKTKNWVGGGGSLVPPPFPFLFFSPFWPPFFVGGFPWGFCLAGKKSPGGLLVFFFCLFFFVVFVFIFSFFGVFFSIIRSFFFWVFFSRNGPFFFRRGHWFLECTFKHVGSFLCCFPPPFSQTPKVGVIRGCLTSKQTKVGFMYVFFFFFVTSFCHGFPF